MHMVKLEFSLCLIKYLAMKTYREGGGYNFTHSYPRYYMEVNGIIWISGCVKLGREGKGKISTPAENWIAVVETVASH